MARLWKCRKCGSPHARRYAKCQTVGCSGKRPAPRQAAHKAILSQPYEVWAEAFGEECGVCGRPPASRRLDRDHDHSTGEPRGLLCHRCNRALASWVTPEWLRLAATYLERERTVFPTKGGVCQPRRSSGTTT